MTLTDRWTQYRRLRAPQEDGAHLIEPPVEAVGELLEANRVALSAEYDFDGVSLSELRESARAEFLAEAHAYTNQYADVAGAANAVDTPLLLTGHQAELFHPGVWLKNFLVGDLARIHGGIALHIVIDADLFGTPSIRVPTGSVDSPSWQSVEFDAAGENVPTEERQLVDRDCFRSFGHRAEELIAPFVSDPVIRRLWPLVEARDDALPLGHRLAQARHLIEREWGSHTLEVPQSAFCDQEPFRRFLVHMLHGMPRLASTYNSAVRDFREANRIRSAAHPVPDLAERDGWLESPFWMWTREAPTRRPLFVREGSAGLEVSDLGGVAYELPSGDADAAVERLAGLAEGGLKIRPRALMNTLYCRLILGDLFVHGIGGAKYDQLTDQIIADFFELEPPAYMVATGTLRLPVARPSVANDDRCRVQHQLRELTYHPECFLDTAAQGDQEFAQLVEEKLRWVRTSQTRENGLERCHAIRNANSALQPAVQEMRDRLSTELADIERALSADALLGSREWSCCLHSEQRLRQFLHIGD